MHRNFADNMSNLQQQMSAMNTTMQNLAVRNTHIQFGPQQRGAPPPPIFTNAPQPYQQMPPSQQYSSYQAPPHVQPFPAPPVQPFLAPPPITNCGRGCGHRSNCDCGRGRNFSTTAFCPTILSHATNIRNLYPCCSPPTRLYKQVQEIQ